MLILHAGMIESSFVVWGEAPADAAPPAGRSGRPKRQASSAQPSPWNAKPEALLSALTSVLEAAEGQSAPALQSERFVAWLPTLANAPIPSSPLLAPLPEENTPCALTPWQVTGVALSWEQTVALLCACVGKDT